MKLYYGEMQEEFVANNSIDIFIISHVYEHLVDVKLDLEKIFKHFQQYGGIGRREGNYPGWKPNTDSAIYRLVKKQYQVLFGHSPQTMVIHAGLECGLFSSKYPNWDMVSFGPTIKFPHSPDEKVHIPSVDKYWKLLIATLQAIE